MLFEDTKIFTQVGDNFSYLNIDALLSCSEIGEKLREPRRSFKASQRKGKMEAREAPKIQPYFALNLHLLKGV